MTPNEFCYWLQGYFDIAGSDGISAREAGIIQSKLEVALKKDSKPTEGAIGFRSSSPFAKGLGILTCSLSNERTK